MTYFSDKPCRHGVIDGQGRGPDGACVLCEFGGERCTRCSNGIDPENVQASIVGDEFRCATCGALLIMRVGDLITLQKRAWRSGNTITLTILREDGAWVVHRDVNGKPQQYVPRYEHLDRVALQEFSYYQVVPSS